VAELARTVLLLGSSGMVYTDTGSDGSLPNLLAAELTQRTPSATWIGCAVEIPPARDMASRVAEAVQKHRPDAVVLATSASYVTYDYIVARVRRRWPRLFGAVRALSSGLKALSGPGFEGSSTARGWLFRAPRWFALQVVGEEPYMRVAHAGSNVRAALDYLADQAGLVTICKLPTMSAEVSQRKERVYQERLREFQSAMRETCEERGIPFYELREAMAADGKQEERVSDGLHSSLATRRWDAAFMAELILEGLSRRSGSRQAEADSRAPRTPHEPGAGSP